MTLAPSTVTAATSVSEDCAEYVTPSPVKWSEAVTLCVSRSASVTSAMLPRAVGAGGRTVTVSSCRALAPALVTSSATVAEPTAIAVSVSCESASEASTMPAGDTATL